MGKRLLLIDRGWPMYDFINYLKEIGFDTIVDTSSDVLARLAKERFDILIIGAELCGMALGPESDGVRCIDFVGISWQRTGIEIIRRLRAGELSGNGGTSRDVPVILFSTQGKFTDLATACFDKPFELSSLEKALKELTK